MPGTSVLIGLNSLLIPTGASGFRSYMSCTAAPPSKYRTITFLAFAGRTAPPDAPDDSAARSEGRLNAPPRNVRAPAASVSRRVTPSQQRRGLPSMRNRGAMATSTSWEFRREGGGGGGQIEESDAEKPNRS